MKIRLALLSAATLLVSACQGAIGDPGVSLDDEPPPIRMVGPTGTVCTGDINAGATPIRRLSQVEYNNTVRDLLGDDSRPAEAFPPDEGSAAVTQVTATHLHHYLIAAESLSETAWQNERNRLLVCDPVESDCAQQFVEDFGLRAFRRPLLSEEVDRYVAIHTAGDDFADGSQRVIASMLLSPHFLYRLEFGEAVDGSEGLVRLDDYEVASRLSFLLWRTMPDDTLLAAAAANELQTAEQIEAQARRMFDDPRVRDSVQDVFHRWLGIEELEVIGKDTGRFPEFDAELRSSMTDSVEAYVDWVMWEQDGSLDAFLTAPVSFVDDRLAAVYGVEAPAGGMGEVALDPTQRAGILSHPTLMTINATAHMSSPVLRGKLVREQFLCQRVPDPPPGIEIQAPEPTPGVSARERWAEHSDNDGCSGCHSLMDPIGFGFESFDALGHYRTMDEGNPVDDNGVLNQTDDVDGTFTGVVELANRLAGSEQVQECVARQWFRLAFNRIEGAADDCSVATLRDAFQASGGDMRELFIALTRTEAFTHRRVGEVSP